MKRSNILSLLLIASLAITAAGCKKKPVSTTTIPGQNKGAITSGPRPLDMGNRYETPGEGLVVTDSPETGVPASNQEMNQGAQDRATLQAQTIYFDLDSSTVKSSEREKLQQVADYLKANPSNDVLIEGHCDERGTEGYNQSLGEKRALAAREALVELGAPAVNIYTTSFGETRPAAEGSGEEAWRLNRRAEFVVVQPAAQ